MRVFSTALKSDNQPLTMQNLPSYPKPRQDLIQTNNVSIWALGMFSQQAIVSHLTRPEQATALICRELEKAGIDICALSKVRQPGTGNITERSHTIFGSGGEDRIAGVGFIISNKIAAQGISPTPISDRLM